MMQPGEKSDERETELMGSKLGKGREDEAGSDVQALLIPTGGGDEGSTKKRPAFKRTSESSAVTRRVRKTSDENARDKLIKYSALFLLVAQMVGLVLLM